MELNNTSVLLLLVINRGARSGYDIKQFIDRSARHFWAASYGRIYPELKRLSEAGLIEGTEDPTGGRPKTVFTITDSGHTALEEWYRRPPETLELRDEAMLKIFFGGAFDAELVEQHIKTRRGQSERVVNELRELEPSLEELAETDPYPLETLRCGIAMHESVVAWCDAAEKQRSH